MHEVQRHRGGQVLQPLAEGVGEPREAPHRHPHGEVLALYVGRADVRFIGITLYHFHAGSDAL